jgi:hypothetical protein
MQLYLFPREREVTQGCEHAISYISLATPEIDDSLHSVVRFAKLMNLPIWSIGARKV